MRKIIAAFNMTLDGYCDHTSGVPDDDIHNHYADLLNNGDGIIYGRKTFELMGYWKQFLNNPSGEKSTDEFSASIDRIPKIVFSNTLKETGWGSARIANRSLKETVLEMKSKPGNPVYAGSRSIINQLLKLNLVDELQLCIYPVIAGGGLPLFDQHERKITRLSGTKTFSGGSVILYYNLLGAGI